MTISEEFLEKLQQREKTMFPEPFQKSALTEADLQEIEHELGYTLPKEYREFLQSNQMPDITVYIAFCGDSFGCSFSETFSRERNSYISVEDNPPAVLVDFEWYGFGGKSASDWLEQLKRRVEAMSSWLEAGYINIGMFYMNDYFVFYDLTTGKVLYIHNEDINENEAFFDGWDEPEAIRAAMDKEAGILCKSFNDFLRLVCLGEPYNEDELVFTEEDNI